MRKFLYLLILLFVNLPFRLHSAETFTPEMMPNVNISNRYDYVSDPAGLLSPETTAQVNRLLWNLRQTTSAEMVVAIPPSIGDTPIELWSEQLFTKWGIGKSDKDNGVLLVIAPEQRKARIQTGYGAEGVLPDITCRKIIDTAIVPNMREGNLDKAVLDATALTVNILIDPSVADELKSKEKDNFSGAADTLDSSVIITFISYLAGLGFLVSLAIFISYISKAKRQKDYYHKAVMWRDSLPMFGWMTLISVGTGAIFWLIAFLLYRRWRTRPRPCSTCGAKMKRLGEEEDNELLSPAQDFEEKLNTIDYDVWECPTCGTIERYPYKSKQQEYSECPRCHTVAMKLIGDRTTVPATTRQPGMGERIYECQYCGHRINKP
ncbi:MAG: TPM domain-containing protein, partial [Muribaculaceae bacterium]|nr:TPM domain-containing protein [Muribaculaceae bacterium]